jgi:hypothetical protein
MKTLLCTKTLVALALAIVVAAGAVSQAQEQPIPPPASDNALPADIVPGSALAEVVKMIQAGVEAGTIKSYIVNSQSAFNLDADKILFLKDEGVPSDLINAMLERDKILYAASAVPAPAPAPVPAPVNDATVAPDTALPPADVTVNYFDDALTPYGSWVDVDGYGSCWRPTAVIYDPAWRPYCDRGHWVYTDYGWYWDSDYSWGVTFHYGRWFRNPRFGWCWYPDTVWAPSWVTWRSDNDYCGWAPLPPLAVYRPGLGFYYRGMSVAVDFDFGLDAGCFTFISPNHFCDRRPRYYCVEPQRAAQIFHQTRVVNDFNGNGKMMVNRGISAERINSVTHRSIQPVRVGSLPNAGRQGWRGEGYAGPAQHGAGDNTQFRHGPALLNKPNSDANANRRQNFGQPAPAPHSNVNPTAPPHSQPSVQPGNRNGQRDQGAANQNHSSQPSPNVNSPANNNNGQNGDRLQRLNSPPVIGNNRFPQAPQTASPTSVATSIRQPGQNNLPPVGNNHVPLQNQPQNIIRGPQPSQPRQFIAPVTPPARTVPQNGRVGAPVLNLPPQHSAPQIEQRQFIAPAVPSAPRQSFVAERPQPPAAAPRVEPRNSSPPPHPAPAPAQSPPRNAGNGPDKDKQNH